MDLNQFPPLLKQYFEIQNQYPEYFIFIEIGSFFEIMQYEDLGYAKKAAEVADLVLTKKNKSSDSSPFMAGFPAHTADSYFKKIVSAGYRIVVVSQSVDQVGNKRVATRKIDKILSPGTIVENLSDEKSNYFACLFEQDSSVGISLIDLSTGEVRITEITKSSIEEYLNKIKPSEILICGDINLQEDKYRVLKSNKNIELQKLSSCGKLLGEIYDINDPTSNPTFPISVLGLERWRLGTLALGNLLNYIASTEYNANLLKKIDKPKIYNEIEYLTIPLNGARSLEIFESQSNNQRDALVFTLDKCKTAMGKRKLREWLTYPLVDINELNKRYDKIEHYIGEAKFYPELKSVYDIQRFSRRMLLSRLMPHELNQFYDSLKLIKTVLDEENPIISEEVTKLITYLESNIDFNRILDHYKDFEFFKGKLFQAVEKDFLDLKSIRIKAAELKEEIENVIRDNKHLIKTRGKKTVIESESISENEEDATAKETEAEEGIIILEEEKSNLEHYLKIRKKRDSIKLLGPKSLYSLHDRIKMIQRVNIIEIVDEEWEGLSEKWMHKETKYNIQAQKAWEAFQLNFVSTFGEDLTEISNTISEIDVLTNFAQLSIHRSYSRPILKESNHAEFNFINMRHPVVELSELLSEKFVANDVCLDSNSDVVCLYGANSAGKSTILKSVAINILMAQIGCFIPSNKGSSLVPFEAILTRMTTFDSLSEGLSTFTMEMKELQVSLKFKKKKTLFLFDEIGRGTSVDDGEAIAFATIEYLSNQENNAVTFFATHYHNLYDKIKGFKNILVKNLDCYVDGKGKMKFSRVLQDGPGTGSYGIDVAQSCGLPEELIRVAKNYNKNYTSLKKSRYNSNVEGTICPICNMNPVQETHHIKEQLQGKVKFFMMNGVKVSINHKSNLIMLCSSCHDKITKNEIIFIDK